MRPLLAVILFSLACEAGAQPLPIFDAHLHYSHDAWELVPVPQAIDILRKAGLRRALISSAGDDGQQRLYQAAPDLVIPELRPYRTRADVGTWFRDESVIPYLEDRLARYKYAGIGEFHLYGADADLPVPRKMVELARKYNLFLHAHSDVDAVERLFRQWPQARILWAHAGFDRPERVAELLKKHSDGHLRLLLEPLWAVPRRHQGAGRPRVLRRAALRQRDPEARGWPRGPGERARPRAPGRRGRPRGKRRWSAIQWAAARRSPSPHACPTPCPS